MARHRYLFILFAIIVPQIFGQCTKEKAKVSLRRSVYDFSVELLSRIAVETEGHFVASTLSPWALLSAIALGAADNTLLELHQVLKLHRHQCFNNKYHEIINDVNSGDPQAILERSSSLYIDDTMSLQGQFKRKLEKNGVCKIVPINFENFGEAARFINDEVSQATHGIIQEIVQPTDLERSYFIMIDALYFSGKWKYSFPEENTDISPFYDMAYNEIGRVNLMSVTSEFNYAPIDLINSTVVELPYGDQGRFSMLIFLPNDGVSLNHVINSLKKISLRSIFKTFEINGETKVVVNIPRFKMSSSLDNLKELLIDMGLRDAFDSASASFPHISRYSIYVSNLIQKADIEVKEDGTEAAAATELEVSLRSYDGPPEFIANRPFFYMIVDRETELPVFSGAYSKPSVD